MTTPTREDLFKIGADVALARSEARGEGRRLSPEEIYTEGSDANIIIAASSAMGEEVIRVAQKRVCSILSSSAEGPDLDRVISDRYNGEVPRLEAAASIGFVQFTRDLSLSSDALTLPADEKLRARNGQSFILTAPVTFPADGAGPITGMAQAIETGPQGNVQAGELDSLTRPSQGVFVTNSERTAGGSDIESDGSYRSRSSLFFRNARRGTISAIEFGALMVPGVRQATAIELVDENGDPNGRTQLFIADDSGASNAALAEKVRLALSDYRAAGATVYVFSSNPRFELIVVRARFGTNVDSTLAFNRFRFLLVARMNELAPNATLERSLIFEVARQIEGMIVLDDFVVTPAGDVLPESGESIRTQIALVSVES